VCTMRKPDKIRAIFCSDIHLSLNAPIWRSAEPDWFAAMKRPLMEISRLSKKYDCPVICAGDIFDKWNSPPELINFAINYLPDKMHAIPGQHDLPLHNIKDIKKSAFWTLVEAGKIIYSKDLINIADSKLTIYNFPYGQQITPTKNRSEFIQIALVHQYVCIEGYDYPNAPDDCYLRMNHKNLIGYDIIVYGDNHKGFKTEVNHESTIFNCGSLMRRKSDEIDYKPQIGLLTADGKIKVHYLDTSKDKHLKIIEKSDNEAKVSADLNAFFKELEKLGDTSLDFEEIIKQYLNDGSIRKRIKKIILKAMEKKDE